MFLLFPFPFIWARNKTLSSILFHLFQKKPGFSRATSCLVNSHFLHWMIENMWLVWLQNCKQNFNKIVILEKKNIKQNWQQSILGLVIFWKFDHSFKEHHNLKAMWFPSVMNSALVFLKINVSFFRERAS